MANTALLHTPLVKSTTPMAILRLRWANRTVWLTFMQRMGGGPGMSLLEEAVGRAAIRTQQAVRQQLDNMVYSQPAAASGYIRTGTLMRSTHAAPPGKEHSGDEGRARGGEDLAATEPKQTTQRQGAQIRSEVGTWISYSEYVVEGAWQPSKRPFVDKAQPDADKAMREEVELALIRMGGIR